MFKDIAFGQYYPASSVIHRMDARMKLFLTVLFVVAIFFVNSYFGFMLTAAFLLLVILLARLPMMSVLKSVRAIIFIVLFAAIINLFMINEGVVLWSWKSLHITDTAVHTTIKMTLRLVLLICGASLLSLTTTPVEIADGAESLMKPLKLIKVPVHDIAMIMSIALRFIPTLFEETNKIISAQKECLSVAAECIHYRKNQRKKNCRDQKRPGDEPELLPFPCSVKGRILIIFPGDHLQFCKIN